MAQVSNTRTHDRLVKFEDKFVNFNSKVLGNIEYTPVVEDDYDNFEKAKNIVIDHVSAYSKKLSNYFGKMSDKDARRIINFNDKVSAAVDYDTLTQLIEEFDEIVSKVWGLI